jgi:hypothetical protein
MAQTFSEIPAGVAFVVVRDIVNNSLAALVSSFSGTSAPASPVAGQLWLNTSTGAFSIYTGSVWAQIGALSGDGNFVDLTATGSCTFGADAGNAHTVNGLMTFNDGLALADKWIQFGAGAWLRAGSTGSLPGASTAAFFHGGTGTTRDQIGPLPEQFGGGSILKSMHPRWRGSNTGGNRTRLDIQIYSRAMSATAITATTERSTTITNTATDGNFQDRLDEWDFADLTIAPDREYWVVVQLVAETGATLGGNLNGIGFFGTPRI